jgi:glycine hydroxymethyltransferase
MGVGGIALFPADTVYGLACDAQNRIAVERLYGLKGRRMDKPSAVMFFDLELALAALDELGPRTIAALQRLLPGALTVLLPNPEARFPLACGADPGTLGLRVPVVPALAGVTWPVLATSANRAGDPDAPALEQVPASIRQAADLVIDGGELPGTASTVVDLRDYESANAWTIIRQGAVGEEEVAAALGPGRRRRGPAGPAASIAVLVSADLPADYFNRPLAEVDPEIAEVLALELERQQRTLEMIASENFAPVSVLECQGSVLSNKYAEGYPGRRYYGGCEHVDVAEQLAIDRALALFGAEHANVQPHAGAQANTAVYHALLQPGDVLMGLELAHGGHLSHGMKINVSGRLYEIVAYHVDRETSLIDMDEVEQLAHERKPKMIVAGWSAYPRQLDFERFRAIADAVGAYLMVDMAHFAGLVAAGLHPSPVPLADVVTTTIHKTIGGGRGGMILCKEEYAKKIDSAVFPGQQGGPLEHIIAGKAVALRIAASEAFRERQQRTLDGARAVGHELLQAGGGVSVLTGGTDVHLVLCDLRESELDGKQAEDRLDSIGITVNRNAVPFDPRPPAVSSGLRIGSPALATRGLQVDDFAEVGKIIAATLNPDGPFDARQAELSERVSAIADRFPLYAALGAPAAV